MMNPFLLFTQKEIRSSKEDQPAPEDCNRPDLCSRPGSAGVSFRSRMMEITLFYKGFCDFKGSRWVLQSCKFWAPRINQVRMNELAIHFLLKQKNWLKQKKTSLAQMAVIVQIWAHGQARQGHHCGPGWRETQCFIRVSVILRVPTGPSDHANPGPQ